MSNLEIKTLDGGPNLIRGTFTYTDSNGEVHTTPGKAIALCRCGKSASKPFCDGSHNNINFEAPGMVLVSKD